MDFALRTESWGLHMRLSTRSRYGVRALFDMAYNAGMQPVQIKDISRRQEISPRYLEQIFQSFKKAGILKSKRGPEGGYFLARNPDQITVREILEAAEGDTLLVECLGKENSRKAPCKFDINCATQTVWQNATDVLNEYFSGITLKSLCERAQALGLKRELDHSYTYYI